MAIEHKTNGDHHETLLSAPIPSPEILAEYEKLIPGSSETFIKEYLKNRSQQIDYITKVVAEKNNFRRFAFLTGTVVIAGLFGTGSVMAIAGHEAAAAIVSLGGATTAFITAYYARIAAKDQDNLAKDFALISKYEDDKTTNSQQ